MHYCTFSFMKHCTNALIHKYTNVLMHKYTNALIHLCFNVPVHQSDPVCYDIPHNIPLLRFRLKFIYRSKEEGSKNMTNSQKGKETEYNPTPMNKPCQLQSLSYLFNKSQSILWGSKNNCQC